MSTDYPRFPINARGLISEIAGRIHAAIAEAMPEAKVDVRPQGPGHFEISVTDAAFEGLNRVKQQSDLIVP